MSLKAEAVSVHAAGRAILRDIFFTAERGALLLIAGPNGAGKTTLLRSIAALAPFSGAVTWEGVALTGMEPRRRAKTLAYLPQGHVAHWPVRARDVVAIGRAPFASSLTGLRAADETAIADALHAVDAAALADRPVTELSGGERARIMLARALAVGAPLLLADEPVAALDPAHQLSVMALLQRRAREGALVIAVSHDLVLAGRFADAVLMLHEGQIAAFGPPGDVLTPDLLRRIFGIETLAVSAGDGTLLLPWTVSK